MAKIKVEKESNTLVDKIVDVMEEKMGKDIAVLDFHSIKHALFDYFIICHGSSKVKVASFAESIEENIFKSLHIKPHKKEGFENAEWILLDYFDVIVHVFLDQTRDFYKLENLWADAEIKKIEKTNSGKNVRTKSK